MSPHGPTQRGHPPLGPTQAGPTQTGPTQTGQTQTIRAQTGPTLTVIVPVYRQWDRVPVLLHHLVAQTLGADLWHLVLVANDDPPRTLMLAPNMRLIACPTPGAYSARNAGLAQASGDWLVFTDADCLPPPDWLANHHGALPDHPALQAGPVRMRAPEAGRAAQFWSSFDLLRGIPQARYVREGFAATANLAIHRAVFDSVGPFDPARLSGGDAAFCRAATNAGFALTLANAAVTHHPCRTTWADLSRKARRVKAGQVLHGTPRARALALLRTLLPPLRQLMRFGKNPAPLGRRVQACAVLMALWGAELVELVNLLILRRPPERR